MRKEDIKPLIIIVIFFAIVSGIVYFIVNKDKPYYGTSQAPLLVNDKEIKTLNDYATFFTVKGLIDKYQNSIINNDSEGVYNYLSQEYIKENNITLDNVINITNNIDNMSQFLPLIMKQSAQDKASIIFVEGYNYNNDDTKNTYYQVTLDYQNMTYSIYPLELDEYKALIRNTPNQPPSITSNNDNTFNTSLPSDLDMCALYLSSYKYYISFNQELIYRKIVNNRFSSQEEFQDYLNQNINKIKSSYITKYKNHLDDSRANYVCVDNNNITYTFYETSIMNYNLYIN